MIFLASNNTVILLSVAVFLVVILVLVFIILKVKEKLVPSGEVVIDINDGKKKLKTTAGNTLLTTLNNAGILMPSACGGGGTCGMCKLRVVEGGGDILPTEVGFFTRKEIKEKWRLSCQVKVKQDLKIFVPEEIFGIKKWECEVVSNKNVATFIKEFVVRLPEGENLEFKAGQYVQIDIPPYEIEFGKDFDIEEEYRDEWDKYKMWSLKAKNNETTVRAYSMANHPAEGNIIMLNVRIATPPWDRQKNTWKNVPPGIGSSYIFSLKPGDKVRISGPYGDFFVQDTDKEMMFIGGGAGMAPMRSHIFHQFHTLKTKRKTTFWYGARSKREIFYEEHFRKIEKEFPNFKFYIALSEPKPEDNWDGYVGFIHEVIYEQYLKNHEEPEEIEYYMCGPPLMAQAVLKMLDELGVPRENIFFDDFGS